MHILGFIALFAFIITVFFLASLKGRVNIDENFDTMAKILRTNVQKPYWNLPFIVAVEGDYQGRKISCRYFCFLNKPEPELYIVPHARVRKEITVDLTDSTYLSAGRIYYRYKQACESPEPQDEKLLCLIVVKKLSEPEIIRFFEELTLAAIIIEARPQY